MNELLPPLRLFAFIYMIWKALACLSDCPHPFVVVTSESIEPGCRRGDILFLWNRQKIARVGDIAVIWFPEHKLPLVRIAA